MGILDRYSVANLSEALREPRKFVNEVRRLCLRANAKYSQYRGLDGELDVTEEEWDTLVILDGCRYDLFERVNDIDGRLESRRSSGSESWEYLRRNFQGRELHDTVYVTANPHAPKLDEGVFYKEINVLDELWDEKLRTVTPEDMTRKAIQVHQRYPNKRVVVHYMQPHFPFIGDIGREISHTGISGSQTDEEAEGSTHVWYGLRDNKIDTSEERVYEAYRENLELTLPSVGNLIDETDGLVVVTADHGNLVGERTGPIPVKGYGHPRGFYADGLVTVPWLVVQGNERREVTSGSPLKTEDMESEVVSERLADLGYA